MFRYYHGIYDDKNNIDIKISATGGNPTVQVIF